MRNGALPEIGVVHLVREQHGLKQFRTFLDSYRSHPARIEHELVVMLKGFSSGPASEPYRRVAADIPVRWVTIDDIGFDIGAYIRISRRLEHRRLCFLNSFSRIQCDGWLALMAQALDEPGVTLVGATGSWASIRSMMRYQLFGSGPYAQAFAGEPSFDVVNGMAGMEAHRFGGLRLARARVIARVAARFEPFPVYSIRSNAFLASRDAMAGMRAAMPRDKLATLALECGRHSITSQIAASGTAARVAGRDGRSYTRSEWHESRTLWQGAQENLLIADNRTDEYQRADDDERLAMSRYAWGTEAAPEMLEAIAA